MPLWKKKKRNQTLLTTEALTALLLILLFVLAVLYFVPILLRGNYVSKTDQDIATSSAQTTEKTVSAIVATTSPDQIIVTHIKTPDPLKAIYMSSWVAGTIKLRDPLIKLIDDTEINAVVIDIKDYTGRISYLSEDPTLKATGSPEKRIADIKGFIDELHKKNIYVIGRISTFQDAYMVKQHPEYAVKRKSDGGVWKDYKGISWLDAGAKPVWDYFVAIGKDAYAQGFDELNFDYIRFPSDGNMKDIAYTYSGTRNKADVLKGFFEYINTELKGPLPTVTANAQVMSGPSGAALAAASVQSMKTSTTTVPAAKRAYLEPQNKDGIPVTSADLFGMTTSNKDDLGIGQVLENALPYFDYVAPMVYPSHYPPHFDGYAVPAANPYEIIKFAMGKAVERAEIATTSPSKLRPWLQDFSIGHTDYTPEMVRAQMKATNDVGLDSWMLWNAANHYTASALNK